MKNYCSPFFDIPYSEIIVMPACLWPVSMVKIGIVMNFFTCLPRRFQTKSVINNIYCLNILFMLIPMKVFASEANTSQLNSSQVISSDPMSGSYLVQLILGLIVVLLCIVALAWFAKRMNRLQSATGGMLKIIGGISMGSRERVVLLQVGEEQLLIGVSPGRINTLHVLDSPLENTDVNSEKTFATNLAEAIFQKNVSDVQAEKK